MKLLYHYCQKIFYLQDFLLYYRFQILLLIMVNLPEDLFLNSVLALLHQPRRERTLSISLTTAVRKSPTES